MKVLLVNNNKLFFNAVSQSLEGQSEKISISESIDFENVVEDIKNNNSQIVIINWATEDFNIATLCKKIRRIKSLKYIYIIVITKRNKQDEIVDIMESGADDFIFKPFGKEELLLRIKIAKKIIKLESIVIASKKSVIKLAKEDPHTNLLNRRSLMDEVLKEMGRSSREMKFISSIMISIINFKETADDHGSEISDAVLAEFGIRLKTSCRPYDKVGRIGISDFLVFLPDSGISNANKVAERIMSSITKKPIVVHGNRIYLNISIGISELDPDDIAKNNNVDDHLLNDLILDSLIRRAELAMQRAMKRGRNLIDTYSFS